MADLVKPIQDFELHDVSFTICLLNTIPCNSCYTTDSWVPPQTHCTKIFRDMACWSRHGQCHTYLPKCPSKSLAASQKSVASLSVVWGGTVLC